MHRGSTDRILGVFEVNEELAAVPVRLSPEDPYPCLVPGVRWATRPRHGLSDAGLGLHREHRRPRNLSRNRHADQWLHDERGILIILHEEPADVVLRLRNWHASHLDRTIQRVGDRPILADHEIPAEFRLPPDYDPDRVARLQGCGRSRRSRVLRKEGGRTHQRSKNERKGRKSHIPRWPTIGESEPHVRGVRHTTGNSTVASSVLSQPSPGKAEANEQNPCPPLSMGCDAMRRSRATQCIINGSISAGGHSPCWKVSPI